MQILTSRESRNLLSTLSLQEIQYNPSKDAYIRDGIEYPTEDEAYEMLRENDDLEMDEL